MRPRLRIGPWIACTALWLVAVGSAHAQLATPVAPKEGFKNAAAFGVSYGVQQDRDAYFWGFSGDYSRALGGRWFVAGALTWDRETEHVDDAPDPPAVDSFTAVGTVSYGVNDWFSITTGLGKGFADNDNPDRAMRFANGDLGTGIAFAFATPGLRHVARDTIGFSVSYEYNFAQSEASISVDVTFGWSF